MRRVNVVGGSALDAAARGVVASLGNRSDPLKAGADFPAFGRSLAKPRVILEFAHGVFDHAVVARIVRRAVEWDDAAPFDHLVDGVMVERAAIVAFDEQRRSVLLAVMVYPPGDFMTVGLEAHQRLEAVA